MIKTTDTCEYCDGTIEPQVVRAQFSFMKEIIFIDNVPAGVCNHCGERYYDADVYKHMEYIAKNRKKIKKTVKFLMAEYNTATG
ncbi:MAG: YgiT-type zinc finger protein [bacterium]|nr:YgiT-type zinc finger protein [bacterium]